MAGVGVRRLDVRALGWGAAAVLLSAAGGLLVGSRPLVALDVALIGLAAVLVARRPFGALIVVLVARAIAPNTPLLDGLTLGAVGLAVLVSAPRLPGRRVIVPLAAFLLIAIVSTPLAPTAYDGVRDQWLRVPHFGWPYARNPSIALYEWIRLAAVLAVFCLAAWAVRSRRRLDQVVVAILASAAYPVAVGLKQFALGETVARSGEGDRFRAVIGPFSTPGPFSFYLVVVLVIAVVVLLETRLIAARAAVGLLTLGAGACLLLTYTRSAWIAFALAVVVLALLRYRQLLAIGLVGLVVAAVAVPHVVDSVQQRFGDVTSRSQASAGNSWSWRTGNWSAILPYGYARPFTGQGFGSYPRLTVKHFGTEDQRYPTIADAGHRATTARGFLAHNDYVRAFVELGVPGLVLWVATLVGLLTLGARSLRRPQLAPFAAAAVAIALALAVIASSDNLLSAPVMLYAFGFGGALAGAELGLAQARPRTRPLAPEADPAAVEPEPEPPAPEPEPQPAPEPEPAPAPEPEPAPPRAPVTVQAQALARSLRDRARRWRSRRR